MVIKIIDALLEKECSIKDKVRYIDFKIKADNILAAFNRHAISEEEKDKKLKVLHCKVINYVKDDRSTGEVL